MGILLPLVTSTPAVPGDEGGESGIVLAAFARKAPGYQQQKDREKQQPRVRSSEVQFLREFGDALRDILLRAEQAP